MYGKLLNLLQRMCLDEGIAPLFTTISRKLLERHAISRLGNHKLCMEVGYAYFMVRLRNRLSRVRRFIANVARYSFVCKKEYYC